MALEDPGLLAGRFARKARLGEIEATPATLKLVDDHPTSGEEAIFKFFAPELNHVFPRGSSANDQVLCIKLLHADGIVA